MSARAVDFESINIVADPDGLARLQQLGARTVPVVAKGDRYVMGQSLRDVGALLGLDDEGTGMLPPGELVQRLDWILSAAQRYLRQFPDSQMSQELPGGPRSYRQLTYHIFQITRAFLAVTKGEELTYELLGQAARDDLVSFADIADDGEIARQDLLAWWATAVAETDFDAAVPTYLWTAILARNLGADGLAYGPACAASAVYPGWFGYCRRWPDRRSRIGRPAPAQRGLGRLRHLFPKRFRRVLTHKPRIPAVLR